mmetsp:Transcript_68742/g.206183  ORF Transcript_68742/g.206183 Transcript_68742/m.206183 type:complete len:132 (-) Transcript_68742:428-823(-)
MGLLVGGGGLLLSYDYLEPAGFTRSLIRRCMDKSPMPVDCTEAGAAAPIAPLDQLALWSAPALSTLSVGAPLVCWTQAGNLKDGVDAADASRRAQREGSSSPQGVAPWEQRSPKQSESQHRRGLRVRQSWH